MVLVADPVGLKNVALSPINPATIESVQALGTLLAGGLPAALTGSGNLKVAIVESTASQAITGSVTANAGTNLNTSLLALEATQAKTTIALGAALGSNTQTLIGASVTTSVPTYTNGQISPPTLTTTGLLRVDGSNVTQPISGSVTANLGTLNGAALDATLAKLTITQGTALGSNTVALMGASVTTAAPTYTNGQISPLNMTTAGLLRVDASGTTQGISGTVTANIGTSGSLALDATLAKLTVAQGAALGTNTQALMGGSVTTAAPTYTTGQISPLSLTTAGLLRVDNSGVTQPISGSVTANIGTSGSLALDATLAKLTVAQGAALGTNTQALIGASVTTGAPTYTTGQISPLSLNTTGDLRVALASVPSHAVTNAGTFAVQESGAALTALQLIDDMIHSGDATLSKYAVVGAVYDDTSTVAVTENNAQSVRMNKLRALGIGRLQSISADLDNVNTTYNNTTTTASSSDQACDGYAWASLSLEVQAASTPTDIQFIMEGKDEEDTDYRPIQNDFWGRLRIPATEIGSQQKYTWARCPIPEGMINIRLRVVANGTDASKTFTLANAKIGLGTAV